MSDRILGVIGLSLALFFAVSAALIQESFMTDAIGPKAFPYIISAVVALASLVFLFSPDPEPAWPAFNRLAEIGFAVAVSFLYAWVLPELGFLISTSLAAGYLSWRLGTAPLPAVAVGVGTSVGIYVVFRLILGLSLAEGPFGF
ncbi:putative tricarboxylic transport membrane protein [Limimaricola variabilis]|uniref:Tricarboxylic transport membrane protein n=1 Tax=Limimaricola variabilis TaxID=1492771 RepID=A0ABR6HSS9_9RHOB|nr:tripartite tricarboxylate transporter TctB family protein [Limimaricola variabilis]MBB3713528.1 putative tricarboxylic transport membrane protein [Limimaricola variabilis]